jgi:hypothetical protein
MKLARRQTVMHDEALTGNRAADEETEPHLPFGKRGASTQKK